MKQAVAGAALVAAVVLAGCGGGGSAGGGGGGGSNTVRLTAQDNSFSPSELSVPSGAEVTVEFTNDGNNPHTFTSQALDIDTGTVDPGDSQTVAFTAPEDSTPFQCSIHGSSGMTGEVVPE